MWWMLIIGDIMKKKFKFKTGQIYYIPKSNHILVVMRTDRNGKSVVDTDMEVSDTYIPGSIRYPIVINIKDLCYIGNL